MGKGIDVDNPGAVIAVCEEGNYFRAARQPSSTAADVFAEHMAPMSMKTLSETLPFRPRALLDWLAELVAHSRTTSSLAEDGMGMLGLCAGRQFRIRRHE
jgi:hypothetical protein